jgi:outer membrane assembly lipoprotein YfiO
MSARASGALTLLICLFCLAAGAARADLVWHPDTGWQVEGGALAGVSGRDGRNALELMNKAREAEERGSTRSAIRAYRKVAKRYPSSVYASEALYRTGKLYLQRKQYFKAFESFITVTTQYPNTKYFNDIIGEQYRIASLLMDGARNRYWGVIPGFKNPTRAISYFELVVQTAPYSDYAPIALMNAARGYMREREHEYAIDALDRMINNYQSSLLAPNAYLRLAQTHSRLVEGPNYDQGSTEEAITYFEDFLILFPNDENVPSAAEGLDAMKVVLSESKIVVGDFYFHKRNNYAAARVFYNEAITAYPDSEVAEKARRKLAEVDARANNQPPPPGSEPARKKRFFFF